MLKFARSCPPDGRQYRFNSMLRKFISTCITTLLVVVSVFAQDYPNLVSPTKVTTIGYWNNKQSAKYHVTEKSASYKGKSEKPHRESVSEYDIKLKVTDSTEHAYEFELVYTNYKPDEQVEAFVKQIG